MYIPAAEMGEYDSWKPPPQKRMSSKQMLDGKYGGGATLERTSSSKRFSGVERTSSRGRMEVNGGGPQPRWVILILSHQSTSRPLIEIIIKLIKFSSGALLHTITIYLETQYINCSGLRGRTPELR